MFYKEEGKLGRTVINQECVEGNWESVMVSHGLACDSLSPAGLSLADQKIFLPAAGVVQKTPSCWRWKAHLFLFGAADNEG